MREAQLDFPEKSGKRKKTLGVCMLIQASNVVKWIKTGPP